MATGIGNRFLHHQHFLRAFFYYNTFFRGVRQLKMRFDFRFFDYSVAIFDKFIETIRSHRFAGLVLTICLGLGTIKIQILSLGNTMK